MLYWFIWLAFIGYAGWIAPPDSPSTWPLILQLSTGQWSGIEPLVVTLFNLMGIWPLIYAAVLMFDGVNQRFKPGFFSAAAFGVGAFAVLPYLALRQPSSVTSRTTLLKILDARWYGLVIASGTIGLVAYGLTQGNWSDFVYTWQTQKFVHVMSLDFLLLSALFPVVAYSDLRQRGGAMPLWWATFVPLVGAIFYLCLRPAMVFTETPAATQN